jgi:hypothetical protein
VTISYVGTAPGSNAGNDVVLNLVAGVNETADFDSDGDVDGADFLTWQRNVSKNTGATLSIGDANNDQAVDGDDLVVWKDQFGSSAAASAPVPEPGSLALLLAAVGLTGAARVRRAKHGA